jgi:hypothetical protein
MAADYRNGTVPIVRWSAEVSTVIREGFWLLWDGGPSSVASGIASDLTCL